MAYLEKEWSMLCLCTTPQSVKCAIFFSYNNALYRHIKTKKQHVQSRTFKQAVTMCYSSLNNNAVTLFYIVVTDSQHLVESFPCDCWSLSDCKSVKYECKSHLINNSFFGVETLKCYTELSYIESKSLLSMDLIQTCVYMFLGACSLFLQQLVEQSNHRKF